MSTFHPARHDPTRIADLFFYGLDDSIYRVNVLEPARDRPQVPESLVHAIWANQHFDKAGLTTTAGDPIKIFEKGAHNHDQGPDFLEAKLEIGGTVWFGDIELHVSSKDWIAHRHQEDARYNSTILHVALYDDLFSGRLLRNDGTILPELILSPLLNATVRKLLYAHQTRSTDQLPCKKF